LLSLRRTRENGVPSFEPAVAVIASLDFFHANHTTKNSINQINNSHGHAVAALGLINRPNRGFGTAGRPRENHSNVVCRGERSFYE
jgi:hypothetical protein